MEVVRVPRVNYKANTLKLSKLSRMNKKKCYAIKIAFVINKQYLESNRQFLISNELQQLLSKYKIKTPALIFILTDERNIPFHYLWYPAIDKHPQFKSYYKKDKSTIIKKANAFFKDTKLSKTFEDKYNTIMTYYWTIFTNYTMDQIPPHIEISKSFKLFYVYCGCGK